MALSEGMSADSDSVRDGTDREVILKFPADRIGPKPDREDSQPAGEEPVFLSLEAGRTSASQSRNEKLQEIFRQQALGRRNQMSSASHSNMQDVQAATRQFQIL